MSETLRNLRGAIDAALLDLRALRITTDEDAAEVKGVLAELEVEEARLAGLRLALVGEAQLAGAAAAVDQVRNSPRSTSSQAAGVLKLGADLADRFWILAEALAEGSISVAQAEAIVTGLKRLPVALGRTQLEGCQRQLLGYCDELGPAELRLAALRMWELYDPDGAEDVEAQRLAREERLAKAGRGLRMTPDHHGSMRLTGQLPTADAALLQAQLDALMPPASSYMDEREVPSPEARRADALLRLAAIAAASGDVPAQGGDRPHVQITMPLSMLTDGLGAAGVFGFGGETVSAGEARRMACDAGLIPLVLGSASQPLDVGREYRLVPKALRTALTHRDQGCVFPHCTARPAACEAHHIQPWWAGGDTSLQNLVLLCAHHHRLVEPDPERAPEWQWQITIDEATGRPIFVLPKHVDPARRPRQHRRFTLQEMTPPPPAEGRVCPEPEPDPWHPCDDDPWHPEPAEPATSAAPALR
ncbi:HNH endonuclease signature motif containing protein [Tessaracoccus oleiagri]|uniref:HNH endonuclease n=1 Tax=Tessaracoccus oleiagri TaxID=686624 RepID=A0A1G9LTK3_9ACTN|nr:HNH endonuclease signature motif containing protein [Tessaracoccus oleiagri]SDL65061.1 HNH endonuclease [Tessaracoccus oleiagri]